MSNKTLGLALGSGAARGYAHIGVLKVMEEYGIKIDYIAGTSAGALIGAFYSCGISLKMIEKMAIYMDPKIWFDITVPRMGLIKGNKLHSMVTLLTKNKDFSDTFIPFCAVATDLKTGEAVYIKEGKIADGVRASVSIPGVFIPFQYNDKLLVDGAVVERVPVDCVKKMGADIVIGVDLGFGFHTEKFNNIFDIIMQSIDIMSKAVYEKSEAKSNLMIKPYLEDISLSSFGEGELCIKRGEEAARANIDSILTLIKEDKNG